MIKTLQAERTIRLLNLELRSLLLPRKVLLSKKLSDQIKKDNDQAWKENREADSDLKAIFDVDSVEYMVRNQIPF